MPKKLEFIFDFGSPNAYFAYHALAPILARSKAELVINPCLLGGIFKMTDNQPPMLAFGHVKNKLAYEHLEIKRFITDHGLDAFRFNPHFPVITVLMMRAAIVAQQMGCFDEYLTAGLAAIWEKKTKNGRSRCLYRRD